MNKFFSIETARLMLLSGQNSRDNRAFLQMLRDDGDFLQFSCVDYSERNLLEFDNYLEQDFHYAIYRKNDLTQLLGYIGLAVQRRHFEVESYIKRPERRKGYCTEALRALCKTAFAGKLAAMNQRGEEEPLTLEKIYATTIAENLPAQKLLEKNGFLKISSDAMPLMMAYIDLETEDNIIHTRRLVEYALKKPQREG